MHRQLFISYYAKEVTFPSCIEEEEFT